MNSTETLVVASRLLAPAAVRDADAVLVRHGRIAAVGRAGDLRPLMNGGETVHLPGATILPGINDSHIHAAEWGSTRPPLAVDVSPRAVRSIADVAAAVRAAAAAVPPGTWIRGHGWHPAALEECASQRGRMPTRFDLDEAAPDHPVALRDFSAHALWVNSCALRMAGISAATETPAGGDIPRDEHGEPLGILAEFPAQDLLSGHLPVLTRDERKDAIRLAISELHRLGVTSITDPALGPGGGPGILGVETLRAYEELARDGELGVRVSVLLLYGGDGTGTAADMAAGLPNFGVDTPDERWLRAAGVKLFADGIPPLRTAWLSEPYAGSDDPGSLVVPGADDAERTAEFTEMVRLAHVAGRQVAVHATGDRAIDTVVDAFVAAQRATPQADLRHYIIHGDLTSEETLRTMALHRFGLNVQPRIKAEASELMIELLGDERGDYQWPNRSALDVGVPLAFSSDAPVTQPDWREGIAAAALRTSVHTGAVSGPQQRVAVLEALAAYTSGGARQDFAEDFRGRLAPGYAADLCIVGGDLCEVEPQAIPEIPVVATFVDGRMVHGE